MLPKRLNFCTHKGVTDKYSKFEAKWIIKVFHTYRLEEYTEIGLYSIWSNYSGLTAIEIKAARI